MHYLKSKLKILLVCITFCSTGLNTLYSANSVDFKKITSDLDKNDSLLKNKKKTDYNSFIINIKPDNFTENLEDSIKILYRNLSKLQFLLNENIRLKAGTLEVKGGLGTYYVSPLGDDNNAGTSPELAWKTIDKVNNVDFEPGDQILFEGGKTFKGTVQLNDNDSGTATQNIIIGSYGSGRSIIDAQTGSAFIATGCQFLSIRNIDFLGDGRIDGNTGNGISFSFCSNIVIDGVEISGFQHTGLLVYNIGENFQISNIYAHDNGYSGICLYGDTKNSLSNFYIGHCRADNNPGDPTVLDNHSGNGIFAYNASNIIIEYCEASNNGWDMPRTGNGPGGIWVAEVDNAIIQHCISHDNKTSVGGQDGLGFDLDGGTTNSIIQYCLSYNNSGAGFGIFQYPGASDWNNNTVRYCISENDGNISASGSMLFWNGSGNNNKFQGFEFYNNVIYNANGRALAFYDHSNLNFNFRNNIFVSKRESVNGINGENFQGNCWYSLNGEFYIGSVIDFQQWAINNNQEMLNGVIVGMYANPLFSNPGKSSLHDPNLLTNVYDYKVQNTSVVIDAGLDLKSLFNLDPGTHDYFGNAIKTGLAFDIGIHEFENLKQYQLAASPTNITLSSELGSVSTFNITSNTAWSITDDASWLDISPVSGTNNGTITVTANSANTGTYARTAFASITYPELPELTVSITQESNSLIEKNIGNAEVYASISTGLSRKAMPVSFSEAGEIKSISIYHHGGSGKVLMGVYSNESGLPSALLGTSPTTNVNSSAGWQTVFLNNPVTVIPGQTVWLAWVFENGIGIRYTTGIPGRAISSAKWDMGLPESFGSSTIASTKYSIYCSYIANQMTLKKGNTAKDNRNESPLLNSIKNEHSVVNKKLFKENSANTIDENNFKLYPNPAKGIINVEYSQLPAHDTRIFLFDNIGNIVLNQLVESKSIKLDIGNLPAGLYYIKSINKYSTINKKLIVYY